MESVLITRGLAALLTFLTVLFSPSEAGAQQPPRDRLVSEIEELKKSLAEQQKRLEELERRLSLTSQHGAIGLQTASINYNRDWLNLRAGSLAAKSA